MSGVMVAEFPFMSRRASSSRPTNMRAGGTHFERWKSLPNSDCRCLRVMRRLHSCVLTSLMVASTLSLGMASVMLGAWMSMPNHLTAGAGG